MASRWVFQPPGPQSGPRVGNPPQAGIPTLGAGIPAPGSPGKIPRPKAGPGGKKPRPGAHRHRKVWGLKMSAVTDGPNDRRPSTSSRTSSAWWAGACAWLPLCLTSRCI